MHKLTVTFEDIIPGCLPIKNKVIKECPLLTLADTLEVFETALKGAGFCFDGKLTLVEEIDEN